MSADEQPLDHASVEDKPSGDSSELEENLTARSTWMRFVFMLVVMAMYAVSRPIVFAVVVLQFLWVLLSGESNKRLAELGHSLAVYTCQIIDYLTYNNDTRPFPFDSDWPSAGQ